MTKLLSPSIPLDSNLEYRVDLNGNNYIAGAKRCNLSGMYDKLWINGDVFADRLDKVEADVWTPRWTNPFATSKQIKEKRKKEIYIPNMIIAHSGWDDLGNFSLVVFFQDLKSIIASEYQATMSGRDMKVLFEKVHRHYIAYLRKI